jgi:hypothetical protein
VLALAGLAMAGTADIVRLPAPPFPPAATGIKGAGGLTIVSTRANRITDTDAWVTRNRLDLGELAVGGLGDPAGLEQVPDWAPPTLAGLRLVLGIRDGAVTLLVHGEDFSRGHVISGHDTTTGKRLWAFDLSAWAVAPTTPRSERSLAYQQVRWAQVRGGVLTIATAHSTFANASGGRTAYITAIALPSGKLLWRSPALVANAGSFAIAGSGTKRVIVAGYGFTREPDYLTVLDARTGTPRGRVALRSAPERIVVAQDGRLHVRTYDTDVVATLAPG